MLLAAVVVSTVGSSLGLGTCIGALIDMLETVQYLLFMQFFNTEIPPAPGDFISAIFNNTIKVGAIFRDIIVRWNIESFSFAIHCDLAVSFPS